MVARALSVKDGYQNGQACSVSRACQGDRKARPGVGGGIFLVSVDAEKEGPEPELVAHPGRLMKKCICHRFL